MVMVVVLLVEGIILVVEVMCVYRLGKAEGNNES